MMKSGEIAMNRKPRTFVTAAVLALAFALSAVPAVQARPLDAPSLNFDLGDWWHGAFSWLGDLFSARLGEPAEEIRSATAKADSSSDDPVYTPNSSCFIDPNGIEICIGGV
jgi:hypothetical protein